MITKDSQGRITNIGNEDIHTGHSVCNTCGKDMPICWDTVCWGCRDTSCYEHSHTANGYWFCEKCYKHIDDFCDAILQEEKREPVEYGLSPVQKVWPIFMWFEIIRKASIRYMKDFNK